MKRSIHDPVLGELKLDADLEQYLADAGSVRFMVATEGVIPEARAIAQHLERWRVAAKSRACEQLLELKNETWPDEDEHGVATPVTAAGFRERMTLTDVCVHVDGSSTFWFSDGGLFDDHAIEVRVRGGEFAEAVISG